MRSEMAIAKKRMAARHEKLDLRLTSSAKRTLQRIFTLDVLG
jgi:hypothetical protein